ncbi:substrate-binding domain-containing protein [Nocardioides sp. KIGAM211]|uniref:Substrate-binding domain-containing protein n=1 Tax=Nocardioides luti TaxID=2761101 RepID=A0A7X0RFB9_9ACTN|nr:substrate-binding domain-containing protein [Nocardioides luti]MBB6627273.1 substrate-binding domain-containing protein [Nocardioides luti]
MRRPRAAAGVLLAVLLVLTGCSTQGQDATDVVSDQQARAYQREVSEKERLAKAEADLPSRPSGVVDVDGSTRGSLTTDEANRYEATGTSTAVNVANNGEDQAFQELCAGRVDLVDSARPISRAEWDACRSVGLDVVQFQIAAEAIVVAIKSETDVGGDCLTMDQVRDIYRAGSPVVNWGQVGLDDVPLRVGGPNQDNNAFGFFGRYVLDAPQPSLTNLRSDYSSFENDEGARRFVVGSKHDARVASRFVDMARRRSQAQQALTGARDELASANEELAAARAERAKGIRDKRSRADQAKDIARVDAAVERRRAARARVDRLHDRYRVWVDRVKRTEDARKLVATYRGHVAYFRFSYYELFEDQLRPFEITRPDGQRNCIFPSQSTITSGEYPLSRQLLITTTTRSLGRREVSDFLKHYLARAQDAAVAARLVPLPDQTVLVQRAWLTGDSSPLLVTPDDQADSPGSPTASEKPAR